MVRWVEKSRLEVEEQRRKYAERRAERRAEEEAAKNGGEVSFIEQIYDLFQQRGHEENRLSKNKVVDERRSSVDKKI